MTLPTKSHETVTRFATAHVVEAAPVVAEVERDYAVLAENIAETLRLAGEEDRLREALEATEEALNETEARIKAARLALTCSILKAVPREIPPLNHWHRLADAPWQIRSGNRIFALVPAKDADIPTSADELPDAVTLAIIDLDPEAVA